MQDLPRTFPSNEWMATAEGQAALGRVLLAFSVHRPAIGYCQSMNYIAALLLVAMEKDEENAFWVLVSLIDDGGGVPPPWCFHSASNAFVSGNPRDSGNLHRAHG